MYWVRTDNDTCQLNEELPIVASGNDLVFQKMMLTHKCVDVRLNIWSSLTHRSVNGKYIYMVQDTMAITTMAGLCRLRLQPKLAFVSIRMNERQRRSYLV